VGRGTTETGGDARRSGLGAQRDPASTRHAAAGTRDGRHRQQRRADSRARGATGGNVPDSARARKRRARAAGRLRQRHAAAPVAGGGATARDRDPARDRLRPRTAYPHAADRERASRRARDAAERLARLAGAACDASDGSDDAAISDGSGPSGARRARRGVARRRSYGRTRTRPRISAAADHAAADGRRRLRRRTPSRHS
jgi:hypothetical protein